MNYLFVCTYNKNRSRAAAYVFSELLKKHNMKGNVKHAGVSELAENKINKDLINWADKIYVMEDFHKGIIVKMVPGSKNKIEVLGIQDLYSIDDPFLTKILIDKLRKELKK